MHTHNPPPAPFLPFIFSALHPSLVCHGRSAANPSRVGARRATRACVWVCVCVCVCEKMNMWASAVFVHQSTTVAHPAVCASPFYVCMQASPPPHTHTHTPFLAFSPLINSVAGECVCVCVCVCVCDTKEVDWPLPFPPCSADRSLDHGGLQRATPRWDRDLWWNIKLWSRGVCLRGGLAHTHTHTHTHMRRHTHTRTAAHLIEPLPYSAKSLPLSHYDLAAATSQHYWWRVVLFT